MKSFFHMAARAAVLILAVSCTEDPTEEGFFRSDEECSLSMDVGFTSFSPALDTRAATGGTPGNAIGAVNSLQVLFYSNEGTDGEEGSARLKYVFRGTPTTEVERSGHAGDNIADGVRSGDFTFTRTDEKRKPEDGPTPDSGISGASTQHMTFRLDNLQRGRYRIYVVANMPDEFDAANDAKTVTELRNYKLKWNAEDIAANNAMFGYFMTGESSEKNVIRTDAPILSVSGPMDMHAWLKRAVSKVTVAFDGTNLDENVYIYIKSVQIKDIPKTCLLGNNNTPKNESELDGNGETIIYDEGSGETNIQDRITRGNPYYPRKTSASESDSDWKARVHSADNANSLFFFENVQENGIDDEKDEDGSYKPQTDSNNDRIPDDNDENYGNHNFKVQKDRRPYGTYIEVKAYYRNDGNYEVSRGDIIYRFMLGKDHLTSFDVERSIHYKVTLKFNNNANDVDWHIEIDEDPGIYAPEEYYVSYGYGEVTEYPIRIVGEMTGNLKAEIVENNWGGDAANATNLEQYPGQIYFGILNTERTAYQLNVTDPEHDLNEVTNGICNGFLQLRKLMEGEEFEIGTGRGADAGTDIKYNETYWNQHNLGSREYTEDEQESADVSNQGIYHVEKDGQTTSFTIPLYTRQMKLMTTTGYSGMNPYYSLEGTRVAKIRFTATVNGERVVKIVKILQRPRIENPAGIWRAYNNSQPFDVTLQYRETESENALHFIPVQSLGPWEAEITKGGFFTLQVSPENGRQESTTKIHGYTDTNIKFKVVFNGTIGPSEARCGFITIKYHNYSCTHHIFVRQGYAPIQIADGGPKWHCFNLYADGVETSHPCEEGSMFRAGNLNQPISETNNQYSNFNVNPGSLALATGGTSSWRNITYSRYEASRPSPFGTQLNVANHTEMNYTNGRLPVWKDFRPFIKDSKIKVAYGVLYADGAIKETDDAGAFNYTRNGAGSNGMRGAFVYNTETGSNVFFPIGKSGYGRRQAADGVLRYANRNARMNDQFSYDGENEKFTSNNVAWYRPLLYALYANQGAIYWSGARETASSDGVAQDDLAGGLDPNFAFDINYKTYDLNGFGTNMEYQGNNSPGACYIRLVSD